MPEIRPKGTIMCIQPWKSLLGSVYTDFLKCIKLLNH
jgi:hypothetical protein